MADKPDEVKESQPYDGEPNKPSASPSDGLGDLVALGGVDSALAAKMNLVNDVCASSINKPHLHKAYQIRQSTPLASLPTTPNYFFSTDLGTWIEHRAIEFSLIPKFQLLIVFQLTDTESTRYFCFL